VDEIEAIVVKLGTYDEQLSIKVYLLLPYYQEVNHRERGIFD